MSTNKKKLCEKRQRMKREKKEKRRAAKRDAKKTVGCLPPINNIYN